MASPLKDIKTEFCECSICLLNLKNPKQLPSCLHKFCKDCLDELIRASYEQSFKCPLCKLKYTSNDQGAGQFKTDHHTANVIQFIEESEKADPDYEDKMAAPFAESLMNITKQFFECPLCIAPFKDPKQLPRCLHRVCRECLDGHMFEATTFNCPVCWEEYITPEEGVDFYKSDFLLKSVVDIIQKRYFAERSDTLSLPVFVRNGTISERGMMVVVIKGIAAKKWQIQNMTSSRGCRIFVTGIAGKESQESSHITLTNLRGEVDLLHQVQGSIEGPVRYCDSLTRNKVVTICMSNQFVVYNIRSGHCIKKDISAVTKHWPMHQYICCLTVNHLNKHIFVGSLKLGGDSKDVLVFDGQLKYLHTLKLPQLTRELRDITIHNANLVVCDSKASEAYAVATNADEAKLVYKFNKPDALDPYPFRVCADSCGHIYMLWNVTIPGGYGTVLTQYSQNGRQLLTTMPVDKEAFALCTALTDEGEKLIVATRSSGKLYIYRLVT